MHPMQESLAVRSLMSGSVCGCKGGRTESASPVWWRVIWTVEAAEEGRVEAAAPAALCVASLVFALASGGEEAGDLPGVSHQCGLKSLQGRYVPARPACAPRGARLRSAAV